MRKIRLITLTVFATFLLSFNAYAAPSQSQQSPTGLLLEITYYSGIAPAYLPVPGRAWYGRFRSIASWQPPADSLPVQAVNIIARPEGDSFRVLVSAFLGVQHHEKEQQVATYLVREDEKIAISELTQFGVEPFEIKVIRVAPLSTNLPQIINKTESIAVTSIVANNSTLPSYKLGLRNLSAKNVMALGIYTLVNNHVKISSLPHDHENLPLIKAGETCEHNVSGAKTARASASGYQPDAPTNQAILIGTVVFEDGSYEGDAKSAADFRGFLIGRKIQVSKIIPLMQNALNETGSNVSQEMARFKAQVASLSGSADERDVEQLRAEFPNLNEKAKSEFNSAIEAALNGVKLDLIQRLEEFQKVNPQLSDVNVFRSWLSNTKERYEKWLSRL